MTSPIQKRPNRLISPNIHLDRGKYLTEMARFMIGLGFLPQGGAT
jgi:hypothetical protein